VELVQDSLNYRVRRPLLLQPGKAPVAAPIVGIPTTIAGTKKVVHVDQAKRAEVLHSGALQEACIGGALS